MVVVVLHGCPGFEKHNDLKEMIELAWGDEAWVQKTLLIDKNTCLLAKVFVFLMFKLGIMYGWLDF